MLRKNVDGQKVTFSLFKSSARIDNPTISAGDFKVDIDGGGQNNVTTPPTSDASGLVTWLPSQAETNGTYITLLGNDAAGAEWDPITMSFDTSIETVLATVPAAVWAYGTRTLSSFGTLVADVWAYATRTLTQTAAEVADAMTGSDLTIVAAVSFDATLTGLTIPATWTKITFTAKSSTSVADSASLFQIVESNPGVGTDGLLVLNGATGTAAQATLTVDQAAGTIAIHITDNATAAFTKTLAGGYDVKCLTDDGESQQLTEANVTITLTETRTI